ncbi:MAG TPA: hypothetical protein VHX59_08290 [Mycobacteriales bacterium]|jgi:hypothetical protein|nr:hypothetical protein [Mycobacteriales bacterium]
MIGLIAWVVALVLALLIGGVLGYGLNGQIKRARSAFEAARGDLEPPLRTLLDSSPERGRHSAVPAPKS